MIESSRDAEGTSRMSRSRSRTPNTVIECPFCSFNALRSDIDASSHIPVLAHSDPLPSSFLSGGAFSDFSSISTRITRLAAKNAPQVATVYARLARVPPVPRNNSEKVPLTNPRGIYSGGSREPQERMRYQLRKPSGGEGRNGKKKVDPMQSDSRA